MNVSTWFSENKLEASFCGGFLILTLGLGYFAFDSWSSYTSARSEYAAKMEQLGTLANQKPFPNQENLKLQNDRLNKEQTDLDALKKELSRFRITPFGDLEKVKPQDRPQQFQDLLRQEVTKVKSLAASSNTTLPSPFYLGMEEFENRLPQPEEVILLDKQLSALAWLGETVAGCNGAVIAEFSRPKPAPVKAGIDALRKTDPRAGSKPEDAQKSFTGIGNALLTLRCSQQSLRELINAISTAPYFLVIESIQIQNSTPEPPSRTATPQTADGAAIGTNAPVEHLPIIVGREAVNASIKLRIMDFNDNSTAAPGTKK